VSGQALGDVFKHSPFTGGTRLVHLCLGDVANDLHQNLLWLSVRTIAKKAKVSERTARRALTQLVTAGWLEAIEAEDGRKPGPGKPQTYRFLYSTEVRIGNMAAVTAANLSGTAANLSGTAAISARQPRPSGARHTSSPERNGIPSELSHERARRSPREVANEQKLEQALQRVAGASR
jgi:predicted transcriptional regulator